MARDGRKRAAKRVESKRRENEKKCKYSWHANIIYSILFTQNYFKPILKGKGVIETDFQERGVHDYRKDACLTMNDFEKVILHCIIFYNSNRILERFPFTEDMLEAEVKPIPCHVWKWACDNLGANFMDVTGEKLIQVLLPRTIGKFRRYGLAVNGISWKN